MNRVLEIFYNHIVKEAMTGRIECFLYFNMPFSTYIYETNEKYNCHFEGSEELLIPTLIIKNKKEFNKYLIEYTNLALKFYSDNNFPEEIIDNQSYNLENFYREKMILTTLWSNATVEDFGNPIEFLKKRISFLQNDTLNLNLGYIDILEGDLELNISKDIILNETPLQIEISLKNDNNEIYNFPKIKFGTYNNTAYIFAIQNKEQETNSYIKKVNRKLYKVNEGFFDNSEDENLKDITPSFLVALNITLNYLKSIGITNVLVPNVLIARWNAKSMAIKKRAQVKHLTEQEVQVELNKQNQIWVNINDKLNRTFRRLAYHNNGIKIVSNPFDVDSYLHLNISNNYKYNNQLLYETSNVFEQTTKKSI